STITVRYVSAEGYKDHVVTYSLEDLEVSQEPVNNFDTFTLLNNELVVTLSSTPISYKVKFDINGGNYDVDESGNDIVMEDVTFTYDEEEKYLPLNIYKKIGYSFIGWSRTADGEVEFLDGANIFNISSTDGEEITFYAIWNPNTYVIKFNPNGADGVEPGSPQAFMSDMSNVYDSPVKLSKNIFTKTGHHFIGWARTPDEIDVNNLFEDEKIWGQYDIAEDITLYAIWEVNTYLVYFDPEVEMNGNKFGELQDPDLNADLKFDATLNLYYMEVKYTHTYGNIPQAYRKGYSFLGWYNLEELITSESTVYILQDTVLRARYEARTFYITYNANEGEGDDVVQTVKYDEVVSVYMNNFIRENFTFKDWLVYNANGDTVYEADNTTPLAMNAAITFTYNYDFDLVLKAHWMQNYKIFFMSNGGKGVMESLVMSYGNDGIKLTKNAFEKLGYTFEGWSENPNATVNDSLFKDEHQFAPGYYVDRNIVLYAIWTPNPDTYYKTIYYFEGFDGKYKDDDAIIVDCKGTTDTIANAVKTPYSGFTFDGTNANNIVSGIITGDEKLELKLYYKRDTYTLTLLTGNGSVSFSASSTSKFTKTDNIYTFYYNANVTLQAVVKVGYAMKNITSSNTSLIGALDKSIFGLSVDENKNNVYTYNNLVMPNGNVRLTLNCIPNPDTPFSIVAVTQGLDGKYVNAKNEYNLAGALYNRTGKGTTDTAVSYNMILETYKNNLNVIEGFTYSSFESKKINGDRSTTVYVFYSRNSYKVELNAEPGLLGLTGSGTYKFGEKVTLSVTATKGFVFEGFGDILSSRCQIENLDNGSIKYSYSFNMTAENLSYTAISNELYSIKILTENLDGTYKQHSIIENQKNKTGTRITYNLISALLPKDITGYSYGYISNTTLNGTGECVVEVYYTLNTYTYTYQLGNGIAEFKMEGLGVTKVDSYYLVKYSAKVIISVKEKVGYTFDRITSDKPSVCADITKELCTLNEGAYTFTIEKAQPANLAFVVNANANTDTPINLVYYYEALDGTYSEGLKTTVIGYGTTDTQVTLAMIQEYMATIQEASGFSIHHFEASNIDGDGNGTSNIYLTRNEYAFNVFSEIGVKSVTINSSEYIKKMGDSYLVKFGATVRLTVMVEEGYVFNTWISSNTSLLENSKELTYEFRMCAGEVSLTATTSPKDYLIKYHAYNGEYDDTKVFISGTMEDTKVSYREEAQLVTTKFTRKGYDFAGWALRIVENDGSSSLTEVRYSEGQKFIYEITSDLNLYAVWTPRNDTTYTINYYVENLDGTYVLDTAAKIGVASGVYTGVTDTLAEVNTSITYIGYTYNEEKTLAEGKLSGQILGNGELVLSVYYTRNYYSVSVTANSNHIVPTFEVNAEYKKIENDVTYVKYGATVRLFYTIDAGHQMNGWTEVTDVGVKINQGGLDANNNSIYYFEMLAGNVTLNVEESPNKYNINFITRKNAATEAGETTYIQEVTYGTVVTLDDNKFILDGYDFVGWTTNTDPNANETHLTYANMGVFEFTFLNDITLYAIWKANTDTKYTVQYYVEDLETGSAVLHETIEYIGTTDASIDFDSIILDIEGYSYENYTTNSNKILGDGSTLIKVNYSLKTFIVTINKDHGISTFEINGDHIVKRNNSLSQYTIIYGSNVNVTVKTLTAGYEFSSYVVDENIVCTESSYDFTMIAKDYTLQIKSKPRVFNIILKDNYSTGETTVTANFDETVNFEEYYIRPAFNFVSYNTATDGTGTEFKANQSYNVKDVVASILRNSKVDTIELFAIWEAIKYNVIFDLNGAEGSVAAISDVTYGMEIDLPLGSNFTYPGHNFLGWSRDREALVQEFDTKLEFVFAEDITLYAVWETLHYTITFNSSNADGNEVMDNIDITYGYTIDLPENKFTNTGHHFVGWATEENSDVISYRDGYELTFNREEDLTLYAVWEENDYIITYYYDETKEQKVEFEVKYNQTITIYGTIFERSGYYVTKWYDSEGNEYMPYEEFVYNIDGDIEVFADWYHIVYTIVLDGNGADLIDPNTQLVFENYDYNTDFEFPTGSDIFNYNGFDFKGWSTYSEAIAPEYVAGDKVSKLSDEGEVTITFYAIWDAKTVNFTVKVVYETLEGEYNVDDATYTDEKVFEAKTGTLIDYIAPYLYEFDIRAGFALGEFEGKVVAGDGSTVITAYFARNYYALTIYGDSGISGISLTSTDDSYIKENSVTDTYKVYNVKFEAPITIDATVMVGYTFASWSEKTLTNTTLTEESETSVSFVMTNNIITLSCYATANTDTEYRVSVFLEKVEAGKYNETESFGYIRTGTTNTLITDIDAIKNEISTNYENEVNGFEFSNYSSDVYILGDGSAIMNIYYIRNSYIAKVNTNIDYGYTDVSTEKAYRHGEEVIISITLEKGYEFDNWSYDQGLTVENVVEVNEGSVYSITFNMPISNVEVTANIIPSNSTKWIIGYYFADVEGLTYERLEYREMEGTTGDIIAEENLYEFIITKDGYEFEKIEGITIAGDGTSEAKIYYTRARYEFFINKINYGIHAFDVLGHEVNYDSEFESYSVIYGDTISLKVYVYDGYSVTSVSASNPHVIIEKGEFDVELNAYNYTFVMNATNSFSINVSSKANDNTKYKVVYLTQKLNGEYEEYYSEDCFGVTDTQIKAIKEIDIVGFTLSSFQDDLIILGDGTTVLNVYYTRNSYLVNILEKNQNTVEYVSGYGYYKFEQDVTIGASIVKGYNFDSWVDVNGNVISKDLDYTFKMGSSDTTIYVNAIPNKDTPFYVHFYFEDLFGNYNYDAEYDIIGNGETNSVITVENITLPVVTGYEYSHMDEGIIISPDNDSVVAVYFERSSYKLNIELWDGIENIEIFAVSAEDLGNNSYSVKYGDVVLLSYTLKEGYTFSRWNINGEIYEDEYSYNFEMPANNVNVIVVAKPSVYTITFIANNKTGQVLRMTVEYNSYITLFRNVFTYSGYKFAGWFYDENTTFEDKQYMLYDKAGDMTLTAIWEVAPEGQKSSELIIIVSSSVTFISLVTTVTTTIIVKRRKRRLKDE
ncbi:MAG: InlB B-repeat-containing protein, partial [Clostridia bacterium]|nr:InlB B-repeat-containing protein [Clostridia bacterium]